MSARGTGVDVHRVHVRLVWMCTEHAWDLYGQAPTTRVTCRMCTERGTSTDVHLVHVGLGYTPSTRGTGMDS